MHSSTTNGSEDVQLGEEVVGAGRSTHHNRPIALSANATARCGPHRAVSSRMLVASATKARLASSLTWRSSTEGWKEKELLQGALEGQMCELRSRGEVALPAGVDLHAQ